MCGIFGWIWNSESDHARRAVYAAIVAAYMDERGGDSWGYARRKGEMVKDLGLLTEGVDAPTLAQQSWLLGHTRKATTGTVIRANSHPFQIGRIIGAHNGIVSNDNELNRIYQRDCAVDSMHIFMHLDEKRSLADVHCYGAIEWIEDNDPSTVYLAKLGSDYSELSIAQLFPRHKGNSRTKEAVAVVWASTKKSIERGAALAGLVPVFYEIKGKTVYSVEEKDLGVYRHSVLEVGEFYDTSDYTRKDGFWTKENGVSKWCSWKEWDEKYNAKKSTGGGESAAVVATNDQGSAASMGIKIKDRGQKIWDYCDVCNKTVAARDLCIYCDGCYECCYCCDRCGELDIRACRCEVERMEEFNKAVETDIANHNNVKGGK